MKIIFALLISFSAFGAVQKIPLTMLDAPGLMFPTGSATCPVGSLLADGTNELRATYPKLFTAVGCAFGCADSTHFNRADMRGRVIRGVDGTAGNDPDKASRTAMATGGNVGNLPGSVQPDMYVTHNHILAQATETGLPGQWGASGTPWTAAYRTMLTNTSIGNLPFSSTSGGNETRMKNINANWCILY